MLNRMETWEHLTPSQKNEARQLASQFKSLPSQRKEMMQNAIRGLRHMPPDARERTIDSPRFQEMFSPGERQMLHGITKLPLAPAEENGEAPHE